MNLYIERTDNKGNFFLFLILHLIAVLGFFCIKKIKNYTIIFQLIIALFSQIAITGGYHRLWSHRSYESTGLLDLFYVIFGTISSQGSAIWWSKTHRTHHRNEEKPGDPYNIRKGFYNAHMGWILHGNDKKERDEIDNTNVDDLIENKILLFQHNYYKYLLCIFLIILIMIPIIFWKETFTNSLFSSIIRLVLVLHFTWFVNSLAHYCDENKNTKLQTCQSGLVSFLTHGEGWHKYHHAYPKDYRASDPYQYNPTTWFINITKFLGLSKNHYIKGNREISINNRFNLNYYKKI
tara:strand:+ start:75 stop:953 length:879 start_codon:yes stop_codon:yes gene_type:complete